jgi:hypothetical protein
MGLFSLTWLRFLSGKQQSANLQKRTAFVYLLDWR